MYTLFLEKYNDDEKASKLSFDFTTDTSKKILVSPLDILDPTCDQLEVKLK